MVLLVEQALLQGAPLSIYYYSTSKGLLAWRTISPQRVLFEPHARLAAYCHNNQELRWFRIENIQRARIENDAKPVEVAPSTLSQFLDTSVDGFRDGTDEELVFHVGQPDAGWVRANLLPGMRVDGVSPAGELRVVARGAALVVARFVVGLGGAARAETARLRTVVRQLALSAAEANPA